MGEELLEIDTEKFHLNDIEFGDNELPFTSSKFTISEPIHMPGFKIHCQCEIVPTDASKIFPWKMKNFLLLQGSHHDFANLCSLLGNFCTRMPKLLVPCWRWLQWLHQQGHEYGWRYLCWSFLSRAFETIHSLQVWKEKSNSPLEDLHLDRKTFGWALVQCKITEVGHTYWWSFVLLSIVLLSIWVVRHFPEVPN